jgi:hypothetical protein
MSKHLIWLIPALSFAPGVVLAYVAILGGHVSSDQANAALLLVVPGVVGAVIATFVELEL